MQAFHSHLERRLTRAVPRSSQRAMHQTACRSNRPVPSETTTALPHVEHHDHAHEHHAHHTLGYSQWNGHTSPPRDARCGAPSSTSLVARTAMSSSGSGPRRMATARDACARTNQPGRPCTSRQFRCCATATMLSQRRVTHVAARGHDAVSRVAVATPSAACCYNLRCRGHQTTLHEPSGSRSSLPRTSNSPSQSLPALREACAWALRIYHTKRVIDVHRKLVRLPGCEVNAAASPRERCDEPFDHDGAPAVSTALHACDQKPAVGDSVYQLNWSTHACFQRVSRVAHPPSEQWSAGRDQLQWPWCGCEACHTRRASTHQPPSVRQPSTADALSVPPTYASTPM